MQLLYGVNKVYSHYSRLIVHTSSDNSQSDIILYSQAAPTDGYIWAALILSHANGAELFSATWILVPNQNEAVFCGAH